MAFCIISTMSKCCSKFANTGVWNHPQAPKLRDPVRLTSLMITRVKSVVLWLTGCVSVRACACLNATHYYHMDWLRIACIVTLITHPLHLRTCSTRRRGTSAPIRISPHEIWTLLHQLLCALVPPGPEFHVIHMWHRADACLSLLWIELDRKKLFVMIKGAQIVSFSGKNGLYCSAIVTANEK